MNMQICAKLYQLYDLISGSMEMPRLAYNQIYPMQELRITLETR